MAGTDTNGDCGTETFEYPSDRTAGTIYMYGDWSTDFFDNPRDRKLVHQIFLNHRSKQHPDAIMDFEANKMELVRQIASSSDVDEIMLDFFASDISTQNLEITWEALKLNPMNEYVWESRRRILVGLGKLHEELTYLNSNADGDDKLDNEFFCGLLRNSEVGKRNFHFARKSLRMTFMMPLLGIRCGQEEVSQIRRNLELDYARKAICNDPKNEFPWMYLTCLYQDRLVVYYKLELVYKSICLAGMKHRLDVFLNRRQYINALSTVLELICCGYKLTDVVCDTIARLCSSIKLVAAMNEPCPCAATKITISECVTCSCSILQFLDPGDRRHWESLSEDALNSL